MTNGQLKALFMQPSVQPLPSRISNIMTTRRQSEWVADREEGFTINGNEAEN
jgi:hypothetical protein